MAALNPAVPPAPTFARACRGFSLTEMAVVLVIVALLIGGMLMPLSGQDDLRRARETQATVKSGIEALLGFAAANGRLPCPASAGSNGVEAPAGGGTCTLFDPVDNVPVGYLPGATLGLAPLDAQGRVIDAWGNPLRYAVSNADGAALTSADAVKALGIENLAATQLIVCPTASSGGNNMQNPGTANADCPGGVTAYVRNALALVYSTGKNAGTGGGGVDERHNPNPNYPSASLAADRTFVSHDPLPSAAANGEFDDIVIWLSPNTFFYQMSSAPRWNK